jgi:hypothetical protein
MHLQIDHVRCLIVVASNQNVDFIIKLLNGVSLLTGSMKGILFLKSFLSREATAHSP